MNEKVNRACDIGKNNSNQNINASMAHMSGNEKCTSRNYGDSPQLIHWILDSGATCHMTPEVLYFIPGSLEDTGKNNKVADVHHVTSKQKGQIHK